LRGSKLPPGTGWGRRSSETLRRVYRQLFTAVLERPFSSIVSGQAVSVGRLDLCRRQRLSLPMRGLPYQRTLLNRLPSNDHYSGRTAPLTSKLCILYIYSTNTGTEYFKRGINCPFFFSLSLSLQNAVCFIILTYLVPVLFTFYIQSVLKLKKIIIPGPKG